MLTRIINHIAGRFLNQLPSPIQVAYLGPLTALPNSSAGGGLSISDILGDDGFMWATPKRRNSSRRVWFRKYGNDNWKYGTKLFKPKRNIITCMECGDFHEFHTICRTCFKKVEDESKAIIESIRNVWGRGVIDKEVKVLYQGENATEGLEQKRIVELERPRPLWFVPNLSQKSAYPRKQIEGLPKESIDRSIKIKSNTTDSSSDSANN